MTFDPLPTCAGGRDPSELLTIAGFPPSQPLGGSLDHSIGGRAFTSVGCFYRFVRRNPTSVGLAISIGIDRGGHEETRTADG